MNADERRLQLNRITDRVIGCAFKVSSTLGVGFLEKVYENALAMEIRKAGLRVEQQRPVRVSYEGAVIGEFQTDLLVEGQVVVEMKAVKQLDEIHWAQCLNYLKASGLGLALLLNFGRPRLEVKRIAGEQ